MPKDGPGEERFHRARDKEATHKRQLPTEDDPQLPPPVEPIRKDAKVKRNDPCPCGSGKKYKQCCANK